MLKVYVDPCTVNCRKTLAGLELIGAAYEVAPVDYFGGGHKAPAFLAINPNGALPAATDGDLKLSESNAILMYAADQCGADAVYSRDPRRRADIHRWLLWEAASWFPACYASLVEHVVKPLLGQAPDEAAVARAMPEWHRLAAVLDARLAQSRWLTGETPTLADIAVAAPIQVHRWQRLPLAEHPQLARWMTEGVEALPCWRKTHDAVVTALHLS